MKMQKFCFMAGAAVLALVTARSGAAPVVQNNSFEQPVVTQDTYTTTFGSLNPATGVPNWTFGTSAGASYDGLVINNSTLGATGIPDGSQAAFLQGTGTFSQVVSGFTNGSYTVSFSGEERPGGFGPDPIQVTVDGVPLTFKSAATVSPGATFTTFTSDPFTETAGSHTLAFFGTVPFSNTTDLTSFVDEVNVNPVAVTPLPASAWGGIALLALFGVIRLRRKRTLI